MDFMADEFARMHTSDISFISHTHGREGREERHIKKRELKAAVKHGKKEETAAGRQGEKRWKITYAGVVYVTDETMKDEVTSWRLDKNDEARRRTRHTGTHPLIFLYYLYYYYYYYTVSYYTVSYYTACYTCYSY
jgi:hypothetical protein